MIGARRRWTGRSSTVSGSGASPRCRPSRRWTPARSGAAAPSRSTRPSRPARAASTAGRWPTRRSSSSTRSSSRRPTRGSCPPRSTIAAPTCAAGCGRRCAPVGPGVLLVRRHRDDPAADPGRRRVAGCAHHAGRTAVSVFDAHPGPVLPGRPGDILRRSHGAVLVRTGDAGVWIGHVRRVGGRREAAGRAVLAKPRRRPQLLRDRRCGGRRRWGIGRSATGAAAPVGVLTLRVLQRRHVHRSVRAVGGGAARAAAQDTRVLVLRAAARCSPTASTSRHRGRGQPGDRGLAQHSGDRRRLPRDHRVHRPAGGGVGGRQRRRRRGDAGARRGPGAGPGGRDAQPALPDDGSLRLGVLVLRPSAPDRSRGGARPHPTVPADRRGRGSIDGARRRGGARSAGRLRRPGSSTMPGGWPAAPTTADCSTRSELHAPPTNSASRSMPTAQRSSPR